MKTNINTILLLLFTLFASNVQGQDGYTYTLIDHGSYSFSIGAVPNPSSNNFPTSVQSYGFTIILPEGVTATITNSLGGSASASFFTADDLGQSGFDGYLITETLGSPASLFAPSAGATAAIVTIQINGAPTSGTMYILENNSALATMITPLKSFMQADMEDDGMATFTNRVDPNGTGVSGMSSFDFLTLSTIENELKGIVVYPNPAKEYINIKNQDNIIAKMEIVNLQGKMIKVIHQNFSSIDISDLNTGLYLLKIYGQNSKTKIIKLIKK